MIRHDVIQRSPAWHALRIGKVGGSQAAALLATGRSGEAVSRALLRHQLVLERLTGRSHASRFVSGPMRQGIDRERHALSAYEVETGTLVRRVGYFQHETLQAGVSPDGVVGDCLGLVEVKCPLATTHAKTEARGTIPGPHQKQIVHACFITGAPWCDWVSYDPTAATPLQIVRLVPDAQQLASYAWAVTMFLREVDQAVAAWKGRAA